MSTRQIEFERFEYKYWFKESRTAQLLRLTAPHLRRDDWAPGGQRNTSLYLDSDDLDFAQMHIESSPDRFKLRVRAYGDPPTDPSFFEIKRKVKAVIFKRRAQVPLSYMTQLLRGQSIPSLRLGPEEEATLAQFQYLMMIHRAEPKLLVTCTREAYSSVNPGEAVRLTVDRSVCYQRARGFTLNGNPKAWTPLCGMKGYEPGAGTLVEIKFKGTAPWWIEDVVQRLELMPSSYSKYVAATSLEQLGPSGIVGMDLAPRPALPGPWRM